MEGAAGAAGVLVENLYLEILQDATTIHIPNILLVRTCTGGWGWKGYLQNGILKAALGEILATLGEFLGTSRVFLSFPASFLFVVCIFCDVSFCFVESLPF